MKGVLISVLFPLGLVCTVTAMAQPPRNFDIVPPGHPIGAFRQNPGHPIGAFRQNPDFQSQPPRFSPPPREPPPPPGVRPPPPGHGPPHPAAMHRPPPQPPGRVPPPHFNPHGPMPPQDAYQNFKVVAPRVAAPPNTSPKPPGPAKPTRKPPGPAKPNQAIQKPKPPQKRRRIPALAKHYMNYSLQAICNDLFYNGTGTMSDALDVIGRYRFPNALSVKGTLVKPAMQLRKEIGDLTWQCAFRYFAKNNGNDIGGGFADIVDGGCDFDCNAVSGPFRNALNQMAKVMAAMGGGGGAGAGAAGANMMMNGRTGKSENPFGNGMDQMMMQLMKMSMPNNEMGNNPNSNQMGNNQMANQMGNNPMANQMRQNQMPNHMGQNQMQNHMGHNQMTDQMGHNQMTNQMSRNPMANQMGNNPMRNQMGNHMSNQGGNQMPNRMSNFKPPVGFSPFGQNMNQQAQTPQPNTMHMWGNRNQIPGVTPSHAPMPAIDPNSQNSASWNKQILQAFQQMQQQNQNANPFQQPQGGNMFPSQQAPMFGQGRTPFPMSGFQNSPAVVKPALSGPFQNRNPMPQQFIPNHMRHQQSSLFANQSPVKLSMNQPAPPQSSLFPTQTKPDPAPAQPTPDLGAASSPADATPSAAEATQPISGIAPQPSDLLPADNQGAALEQVLLQGSSTSNQQLPEATSSTVFPQVKSSHNEFHVHIADTPHNHNHDPVVAPHLARQLMKIPEGQRSQFVNEALTAFFNLMGMPVTQQPAQGRMQRW